jgi:peptidoglycan/LPS O-acetylase OafA/YrhL
MFGGDPRAIAFPLNPPSWSLSLELWGNLAYALVAPRLSNRLLVLLIAAGAAGLAAVAARTGDLNLGGGQGDVWIGGIRFLFAFSAGIGLQRLQAAGRIPALRPPDWLAPAVLAGLLLAPAAGAPGRAVVDLLAMLVVFPAMIAAALSARESRLSGVLASAARLSYPLYITHWAILTAGAWAMAGLHFGKLTATIATLVLAVAAAWAIERWFDRPLRAWIGRRAAAIALTSSPSAA